jgi:hypothetical protein
MKSKVIPIMLSIMMVSALVGASWTTTNYSIGAKYDARSTQFAGPDNSSLYLEIEDDPGIFGHDTDSMASFDITSVHPGLTILNVSWNFTSTTGSQERWGAYRMNLTDINNNGDFTENLDLVNDEAYVTWNVLDGIITSNNVELGLGDLAISDFQDQTELGFFTIGIPKEIVGGGQDWRINSSNSATPHTLKVETICSYSGSGDWIIGTTCIMSGEEVTLASSNNLFITPSGYLNMQEGSNVTFSGSGQFINIDVGGNVNVCKGCALPK